MTTDENGQFGTSGSPVSFVIPVETLGGAHRIIARGSTTSSLVDTPTIAVELAVIGTIDAPADGTQVSVGDELRVTGGGLGANEEISIFLGGVDVTPSRVDDEPGVEFSETTEVGAFDTTIIIPALSKGIRTLQVRGTTSSAAAEGFVTIAPKLFKVEPAEGNVGTEVLIEGNGFGTSAAISIDLGSQTNVGSGSAGADGSVNLTFIVNQSQPLGAKTLTVRIGADTETRTFEFVGDAFGPVIQEVTHDGPVEVITAPGPTINVLVVQRDSFDIATSGSFRIGDIINGTLHNDGEHNDGAANDTVWGGQYTTKDGDVTKADGIAGPVPITAILLDAAGNEGTLDSVTTVNIDTVAEIFTISIGPGDPFAVGETISITVVSEFNATGTFQIEGVTEKIPLIQGNFPNQYTGEYTVQEGDSATGAKVIVNMTDTFGHTASQTANQTITIDTTIMLNRVVLTAPTPVETGEVPALQSGDSFDLKFTADTGIVATVAILSDDLFQSMPIDLTVLEIIEPQPDGVPVDARRYRASGTISPETQSAGEPSLSRTGEMDFVGGTGFIRLTVTDVAGNSQFEDIEIRFENTSQFQLNIPADVGLIHIPLVVTAVNNQSKEIKHLSDLYDALGGAANVNLLIFYDSPTADNAGAWRSYIGEVSKGTPLDAVIEPDMGIITFMKNPVTLNLRGVALGENGVSKINLTSGFNLIGMPLKNEELQHVSDLLSYSGLEGAITAILVADEGEFKLVARPNDDGDVPLIGGQAFIITTRADVEAEITGAPWENTSSEIASSPVPSAGITAIHQTPVLAVQGQIFTENEPEAQNIDASPAPNGFRATIYNQSTGTYVTDGCGANGIDGFFAMTFVDPFTGRAAQVGDVLEVDVNASNPQIRVRPAVDRPTRLPLRYVVSIDDVRQGRIQLPDFIAYVVPEKTALLPNYPNPFNPETWVPYQLADDSEVIITIHDVTGRLVRRLDLGYQFAQNYTNREKAAYWDGRNQYGEMVAGGLYFYTLRTQSFQATRRMVIVK